MNDIMAQAGELRRTGQAEEARKLLLKALEQQQNDAELWYQTAWTHDSLGLEREAVPYYEKAWVWHYPQNQGKEPSWD